MVLASDDVSTTVSGWLETSSRYKSARPPSSSSSSTLTSTTGGAADGSPGTGSVVSSVTV